MGIKYISETLNSMISKHIKSVLNEGSTLPQHNELPDLFKFLGLKVGDSFVVDIYKKSNKKTH